MPFNSFNFLLISLTRLFLSVKITTELILFVFYFTGRAGSVADLMGLLSAYLGLLRMNGHNPFFEF